MTKKDVCIAIPCVAFGILFIEYRRLVHDFKLLYKTSQENEEKFEMAKQIVTDAMFVDIVENFEE